MPRPTASAPIRLISPTARPASSRGGRGRAAAAVGAGRGRGWIAAGRRARPSWPPAGSTAARSARASARTLLQGGGLARLASSSRSTLSSDRRNVPLIAPWAVIESSTASSRASLQPGPSRRRASPRADSRSADRDRGRPAGSDRRAPRGARRGAPRPRAARQGGARRRQPRRARAGPGSAPRRAPRPGPGRLRYRARRGRGVRGCRPARRRPAGAGGSSASRARAEPSATHAGQPARRRSSRSCSRPIPGFDRQLGQGGLQGFAPATGGPEECRRVGRLDPGVELVDLAQEHVHPRDTAALDEDVLAGLLERVLDIDDRGCAGAHAGAVDPVGDLGGLDRFANSVSSASPKAKMLREDALLDALQDPRQELGAQVVAVVVEQAELAVAAGVSVALDPEARPSAVVTFSQPPRRPPASAGCSSSRSRTGSTG